MLKPNRPRSYTAFLFLLIILSASCKTFDPFLKSQEELDLSIKAYNLEFESKSIDRSARLVHPEHRSQYLAKSLEVTKRITFFEATTLDMKFFNNGVPTTSTSDEGFDRAIVIIRYQLAVLPSTKLKSLIFEQEWVRYQDQWFTIPDLDAFLD
ncbi:MAG: hypothetical protein F3745_02240 [Nitrospinae bacterium]|nr:hypothetical protein [Nitrospinota bacterium]